jgi:hypothetical protein
MNSGGAPSGTGAGSGPRLGCGLGDAGGGASGDVVLAGGAGAARWPWMGRGAAGFRRRRLWGCGSRWSPRAARRALGFRATDGRAGVWAGRGCRAADGERSGGRPGRSGPATPFQATTPNSATAASAKLASPTQAARRRRERRRLCPRIPRPGDVSTAGPDASRRGSSKTELERSPPSSGLATAGCVAGTSNMFGRRALMLSGAKAICPREGRTPKTGPPSPPPANRTQRMGSCPRALVSLRRREAPRARECSDRGTAGLF